MRKFITKHLKFILFAICVVFSSMDAFAQIGTRLPSEKTSYIDPVTGLTVNVLTNSEEFSDSRIYQTHPQWTYDDKYVAIRSGRAERGQLYFVNEENGEIIQVTGGTGNGEYNLSRKTGLVYFVRRERDEPVKIIELNTDKVLADSERGIMKHYTEYERIVAEWPDSLRISGGMGLDFNGDMLFIGVASPQPEDWVNPIDDSEHRIKNRPGGIRSLNVHTGEIGFVFNVDFTMGHVQASPFVSREIVFCHETGGDSSQRMWFGDMNTNTYRPLYIESDYEWVTHETFADADHVFFNVLSHLEPLRKKPSGIFSVNLRNGDVRVLGQVMDPDNNPQYADVLQRARSFWHCNGSSDGKWAVGDDFAGNISVINVSNGRIHLFTTGHYMRPDHAHPYFSSDNKRVLIQSGKLSEGKRLAVMVVDIPEEWNE